MEKAFTNIKLYIEENIPKKLTMCCLVLYLEVYFSYMYKRNKKPDSIM